MRLGSNECAYIYIERGKQVSLGERFSMMKHYELNRFENKECY